MKRIAPYAALAARAIEANFRRPRHPFKLTFCLTFWCNYKCETCNIWKMKPRDELRLDEIRAFFRKSSRFLWVDLTGGEVWLRKDFVDVCDAVTSSCKNLLLLHFPTNGYLTDKIVAGTREIARMRTERLIVTVSTDGDEAMNDEIRGIEGGWRRQIETFRRLREIPGVNVVLGMTLSAKNVDHFPTAFAAARREIPDLRYEDFHVNVVHESQHYLGNTDLALRRNVSPLALADAAEEYMRLRKLSWNPVAYLERAYLGRVRRYLESGATPMACHALNASCFIDSWGNVFPCTIYDRKVGSLRDVDYDLAALWSRPESEALQKEIFAGQCPHCWTPCEAYQSIVGNFLRPDRRRSAPAPLPAESEPANAARQGSQS
jgi:MoaA/NifB/PqqE/SkfB family radical SAM enzyme